MESTNRRKIIVWMLWASIALPGLIWASVNLPEKLLSWELLAFFVLAVIVAFFPLSINGTMMYCVQGVTVAVFLKYGLSTEILLTQIVSLVLLVRNQSSQALSVRLPFNSLMFFVTSVISGLFYFAVGGETGSTNLLHIVFFGLVYQIVNVLINHLFLYFDDLIMRQKVSFFSVDTIWDFTISFTIFPFAIMLYLTNAVIGLPALLLLGIPFLVIAILLRMYSSSEIINADLQKTAHIGHQLAEQLSQYEVLDQFVYHVAELFKADYTYIIDYRKGELLMLRMFENGEIVEKDIIPVQYDRGISGKVIEGGKPLFFVKKNDWEHLESWYMPDDVESIMASPIARNNRIEGVLLIASRRKYAYTSHQMQIMDLLSTYFAVSLEKAAYFEKAVAQSERCGLTKLYNYRYLNETLEKSMAKLNRGELKSLSLIMMDIDHFKKINDTYGHQSGNDILVELAGILTEIVGEEGTVARYGGEEFVVLLPDYGKDLAIVLAERIRQFIEQHDFLIKSDLDPNRTNLGINITLSMGVSSSPEDSDDSMALIRNADRALYIGAKQKGRNKVAAYVK